MTKYALLTLLLVAPLIFWGQRMGPRIQFEETEIDICDVFAGDPALFVYKFRNVGDAPLLIHFAKTSTGAAVADYPREPVIPGDSGVIRVQFLTYGKVGAQQKYVSVGTNDSVNPVVNLRYKCSILPAPPEPEYSAPTNGTISSASLPIAPTPTTCLDIQQLCKEGLRIQLGQQAPLVFPYTVRGMGTPLRLLSVQQSGEVTSVEWAHGPQMSGDRDSILVWFDTQTVGPFSNSVILETNSEFRPLIYLHFEGRIVREEPVTMEGER